jgi:hypothetical protein
MENFRMKRLVFLCLAFSILGCKSGFLKYTDKKDIFKNEEFEKKVLIKEVPASPEATDPKKEVLPTETDVKAKPKAVVSAAEKKIVAHSKKTKVNKGKKGSVAVAKVERRQPELEDTEGFGSGRRPLVDPYRVGEKVTHSVSYFGTTAGVLTFSVGPYLEVNDRKSYNFQVEIKSSRLFSSFYSVQDKVETYVDYETLVPHVFKLDIKESGQLKQAQSFFDQNTLKANYWENKYTEKNGHEEKKQSWEILPFSQNAFSAIFYMRLFKWNVGQEYAFRVSDDEKNIVFKGKALEKVVLETDAGKFDAIKIRAEIVSRGALTQTGDLFLWLSDDDQKHVLRIEAKIKIGTLVSEVTSIDPG